MGARAGPLPARMWLRGREAWNQHPALSCSPGIPSRLPCGRVGAGLPRPEAGSAGRGRPSGTGAGTGSWVTSHQISQRAGPSTPRWRNTPAPPRAYSGLAPAQPRGYCAISTPAVVPGWLRTPPHPPGVVLPGPRVIYRAGCYFKPLAC